MRKNSERKIAELDQNYCKFKVKKYAVKMAIFSKFPEKFKNKIFKKKMLLAAKNWDAEKILKAIWN